MRPRILALALALALAGCRESTAPTTSPESPAPDQRERVSTHTEPAEDATRIATLLALLPDPTRDGEGTLRATLAAELRTSKDPKAIDALLEVLRQPPERQPATVYRQAITSLGALRAASAVDAILLAIFTVPDAATTSNIAERAKVAVASIGPAAVPPIIAMMAGRHAGIERARVDNDIPPEIVQQTGAVMLGAFDDPAAAEAVMGLLGRDACKAAPDLVPIFAAHALGRMRHAPAAEPICRCLARAEDPGRAFPAAEALAFIGGEGATQCLLGLVRSAAYDRDTVAQAELVHELRWEAVRFAALAGGVTAVPQIRKALQRNGAAVRKRAEMFAPMLAALERCSDDEACLDALLADDGADPFAREAAAFARARQDPRSAEVALATSRLFAARDPDVRVSAAVLTLRVAPARACPECTQAFRAVLERERESMPATMQAAVIAARVTIAALGDDGTHVPFPVPGV